MRNKMRNKIGINYQLKQYEGVAFGWIIIRRGHPSFKTPLTVHQNIRSYCTSEVYISSHFIYGNAKRYTNNVKKKFKNLNYMIHIMASDTIDELRGPLLNVRNDLIMEYIKTKREGNKNV